MVCVSLEPEVAVLSGTSIQLEKLEAAQEVSRGVCYL